jgi:phage terminase small subunit
MIQTAPARAILSRINTDGLTDRQRVFVLVYADPESPTYLNATQSHMAVYGAKNTKTAASSGSRTLANEKVQSAIEIVLEAIGLPVGIRTLDVAQIATGSRRRVVKRETHNAKGALIRTDTTSAEPTFAERLKAHETLNKVTGANAAAAAVGDEARRQLRRMSTQVDDVAKLAAARRVGTPPESS